MPALPGFKAAIRSGSCVELPQELSETVRKGLALGLRVDFAQLAPEPFLDRAGEPGRRCFSARALKRVF
jgi:hypothetical protein